MENLNSVISKYQSPTSVTEESVNILDELQNFKNGKYRNEVLACRAMLEIGNKLEYKKSKSRLQALTFSGKFSGAHKKDNLQHYSNFIVIDIDALETDLITRIKEQLFEDKYITAIWTSPSGCGLKALINVTNNQEEHKECFDTISYYLKDNYNVNIDKSGSDVCRLCFVCFDDNLKIKQSYTPFNYKEFHSEQQDEKRMTIEPLRPLNKQFISTQTFSEKSIFWGTRSRNKQIDRDTIIKITKFLKKNNASITDNYNDWFRVACAISNSFTYDLGQKYYLELCRLDDQLHDEYKSQYLLEYCYRNRKIGLIDFSTIVYLATQKGFAVKFTKKKL